jgi:hypothetical protein
MSPQAKTAQGCAPICRVLGDNEEATTKRRNSILAELTGPEFNRGVRAALWLAQVSSWKTSGAVGAAELLSGLLPSGVSGDEESLAHLRQLSNARILGMFTQNDERENSIRLEPAEGVLKSKQKLFATQVFGPESSSASFAKKSVQDVIRQHTKMIMQAFTAVGIFYEWWTQATVPKVFLVQQNAKTNGEIHAYLYSLIRSFAFLPQSAPD